MSKLIDSLRYYHSEGIDCVSTDPVLNGIIGYSQKLSKEDLAEETIHEGLFIPGNSIAYDCIDIIKGERKSLYHGMLDVNGEGIAVVIITDKHWMTEGKSTKLLQVYVKPKYRKKGLGTFLIKCASLYAKKNKIRLVARPFDEVGFKAFSKFNNLQTKIVR